MKGSAPKTLSAGFHSLPVRNPKPNLSNVGTEFHTIIKIIAAIITTIIAAVTSNTVRKTLSPIVPVCAKPFVFY